MKALLMLALVLLAFNASAACPVKRPGDAPAMPDGATASDEEMLKAQVAADQYIQQAETYMTCGVMNRRQHLALVEKVTNLSEHYNAEMAEFRLRHRVIAEK